MARQATVAPVAPRAAHTRCRSSKRALVCPPNDSARSAFIRLTTFDAKAPSSGTFRLAASAATRTIADTDCSSRASLPAVAALSEVRLERDLISDFQFSVVVRRQLPTDGATGARPHDLPASLNCARSASRARVSLDFTVPTATPRENAISS